jgi:hypothetical protein
MATTPSHGIQAGLLAYYGVKTAAVFLRARMPDLWKRFAPAKASIAVLIIILAVGFGMLPDLIGIYGHANAAMAARAQNNPQWMSARDWNGYYQRAHHSDLYEMLKVVPFYSLHIWVDAFFHEEEGGWNTQGYVFEVVVDIVMLAVIWIEWKRYRRVA